MYVKNHGVPPELTARVAAASARFFALPPEEKFQVRIENSRQFRGFMPVRYKGCGIEGKNIQEGFTTGAEKPLGGHPLNGPNQWPAQVPELQTSMTALFAAWKGLSLGRRRASRWRWASPANISPRSSPTRRWC